VTPLRRFTIIQEELLDYDVMRLRLSHTHLSISSRIQSTKGKLAMNTDFARRQMINQQVRAWDVLDTTVLEGLKEVARERFVPPQYVALAFADTAIPLMHGQYMMTPTIEGRVLQALGLSGGERVLEVGTGSGFLTACLATLATHVTSIDIYDDFLDTAKQSLQACDIDNVELLQMDAMQELPEGTFDAIAVTGSVQTLDLRFVEALSPSGRLFVVTGNAPAMCATRVSRIEDEQIEDDGWQSDILFETELAPLVNGALPPQFSF
jgi:protein-L-isoaspartate(D-aspartate) O-methyltransferase